MDLISLISIKQLMKCSMTMMKITISLKSSRSEKNSLLRELQRMLMDEELIASSTDVVVVAARRAWPEYNELHAYICQPKRSFQQVKRVAFYSDGQIYPLVPLILKSEDEVEMKKGKYAAARPSGTPIIVPSTSAMAIHL